MYYMPHTEKFSLDIRTFALHSGGKVSASNLRYKIEYNKLTRVEAESNTSTVTLRVVGGDKKGSLESETVKYGHESYGTRTRK
jgi:hypothetical protein